MLDVATLRTQLQAMLVRAEADRAEVEAEWRESRRHTKALKRQLAVLEDQTWDIKTYLGSLDRAERLVGN